MRHFQTGEDNPLIAQTRAEIAARRLQDHEATAVAENAQRADARNAVLNGAMPGSIPNLPKAGSRTHTSTADTAANQRQLDYLNRPKIETTEFRLPKSSTGLPGASPAGPATVQNTGVTGVNASTPDFGSTRRTPQGAQEAFAPTNFHDGQVGRWTSTTGVTPAQRIAANKQPVVNTPSPGENLPTTEKAGVRTVQIDPKYQTKPGNIGKGEVVGSGKAAPDVATGTGVGPDAWRYTLKEKHPNIFVAGSPENLAFIGAHKNADGSTKPLDPNTALSIADGLQRQRDLAGQKANAPKPLPAGTGDLPKTSLSLSSGVPTSPTQPGFAGTEGTATWPKMTEATPAEKAGQKAAGIVRGVDDNVGGAIRGLGNKIYGGMAAVGQAGKDFVHGLGLPGATPEPAAQPASSIPSNLATEPKAMLPEPKFAGLPGDPGMTNAPAANPVPMPTESDDMRKKRLAMPDLSPS